MSDLPDDLTMIARIQGRDGDSDSVEVDFKIEEDRLILTFDSDRTVSFDLAAVAAALETLEFDFATHRNRPKAVDQ